MGGRSLRSFFDINRPSDDGGSRKVSGPTGRGNKESVLAPIEGWFGKLTELEQFCWAFEILPSEALEKYWTAIWYDVHHLLKSKLGFLSLQHLQLYSTLVEIASGIFGGGKKTSTPVKINDLPAEAAVSTMNRVFEMAGK